MMNTNRLVRVGTLLLLFMCMLVLLPHLPGNKFDMICFRTWADYIGKHGLLHAYGSKSDYPPLFQYMLWLFTEFFGSGRSLYANERYLSVYSVLAEAAGLYYVYLWIDKKVSFDNVLLFNFLNIAFTFNALLWGQVDGILSTFVFIAMYYIYRQRWLAGSIWYAIALLMKIQAVIYLPLFFLVVLGSGLPDRRMVVQVLRCVGVMTAVIAVVALPFLLDTANLNNFRKAVFGSVGRYPYISMNAYNLYYLIANKSQDIIKVKDTEAILGGLSYKHFGLLLFCATSFVAMLPLLRFVLQKWRGNARTAFSKQQLWVLCSLIPLLFFYCNTQMHERYMHPAFIFIIAYTFYTRDWIPYVLMSTAYFINMYKVNGGLHVPVDGSVLFDARAVAWMYLLLIGYLFFRSFVPVRLAGEAEIVTADPSLNMQPS